MIDALEARPARSGAALLLERLARFPRGAAVKGGSDLDRALASRAGVVFILRGDGLELAPVIKRVHDAGKLAAVHLDLVEGLSQDRTAVRWLVRAGADAIISSHWDLVRAARAHGATAIQRLLVVDRGSIEHGLAAISRGEPDIVEVLPGVILPHIAGLLMPRLGIPLLAGGFIRHPDEVQAVLASGALAVSTSEPSLWE